MATYAEVAEKHGITLDQAYLLRTAMSATWDQIVWDWIDCFESEDAALEAYGSEAAMVAEATIDADRIRQFNPDVDLDWVYNMPDGTRRRGVIKMAEEIWSIRCRARQKFWSAKGVQVR